MAGVYMRYVAGVPELDGVTRMVASAVILVSPFPLAAAFFIDPGRGVHGSLWSGLTMRGLFVAGALLAFANRPRS
jgi:hypothetical protein